MSDKLVDLEVFLSKTRDDYKKELLGQLPKNWFPLNEGLAQFVEIFVERIWIIHEEISSELRSEKIRADANHRGWCEATDKWKKYMDENHELRERLNKKEQDEKDRNEKS